MTFDNLQGVAIETGKDVGGAATEARQLRIITGSTRFRVEDFIPRFVRNLYASKSSFKNRFTFILIVIHYVEDLTVWFAFYSEYLQNK